MDKWVWPFPTRSISQENRVDQGWDLKGIPGGPILAVSAGTVGKSRPDPLGFGPAYPYLILDNVPAGAPSDTVYYGHTDIDPNMVGQHVQAGDIIGHTAPGGHNSPPGWLEIGFARHASGAPIVTGSGATSAGMQIKQLLNGSVAGPGFPSNGYSTQLISADTTATTTNPCAVSIPLLGCLLSKSQFRAFGGGVIIIGGVAVAALGIWLVVGHPGSKEVGMAAKLAALA